MSAEDFEQQAPVSSYGAQRRAEWLARLRANAEAMSAASMAAHQQDHDLVTSGQAGLFGPATPQQMAATVAARAATVGTVWGQGRPLERNGGLYDHNLGPAPARHDLRFVDMPPGHQLGESPVVRYLRTREQ